ncbi:DNA polymerase IV [Archaeoglobales archaeon]|nr:MAG: DNA polymerase IV [Archaeoglobales archaeon]
MGKIILHVDMDHFFTAIEERENPELRGKPVVVGADPKKGRGVVSTCNYEARKFGIKSGMPISRAYKLCPDAVFLPVNYELYKKVSKNIMEILRKYADKLERWGLDEAFLDVSSRVKDYEEAKSLAKEIKREIFKREKLTCSIGIGPNKLVAKIASDFNKPDGLTVVRENEARDFLAPLSVRKLIGVGRKTEKKLREMGIKTVGDLASYDPSKLADVFGVMGSKLYLMAQGIDGSEVREREDRKSMGRELTFDEDTDDLDFVVGVLDMLSECVHKDILKRDFSFKTVTLKIRYENFETHVYSKTLPFRTRQLEHLKKIARELLVNNLKGLKIRLIGVRVSNLIPMKGQKKLEVDI